jgi:ribosomal protein L16 Arg81 hydroxylase
MNSEMGLRDYPKVNEMIVYLSDEWETLSFFQIQELKNEQREMRTMLQELLNGQIEVKNMFKEILSTCKLSDQSPIVTSPPMPPPPEEVTTYLSVYIDIF